MVYPEVGYGKVVSPKLIEKYLYLILPGRGRKLQERICGIFCWNDRR